MSPGVYDPAGGEAATRRNLNARSATITASRTGRMRRGSAGLVARLAPVRRITPKSVLDHPVWLPAILNSLALTEQALHTDYDTLSAGQYSQPAMGGPRLRSQLRVLPLDALILAWDAKWLVARGQHPEQVLEALMRIVVSRRPVHLLVHWHPHRGQRAWLDMRVTLRQAVQTLQGGENDAEYLTFDVHEWRDARIPVLSSRPQGGGSSRKRGVELPTTAKLSSSDTLHSLSHDYYGSYRHWREIRDANGLPRRWGAKTPLVRLGRFHVGSKIKIPALDHGPGSTGGASA